MDWVLLQASIVKDKHPLRDSLYILINKNSLSAKAVFESVEGLLNFDDPPMNLCFERSLATTRRMRIYPGVFRISRISSGVMSNLRP